MGRKKENPPYICVAEVDGKDHLFVSVKTCGITYLCLVIDGITQVTFGKEKDAYIYLDDAIKWYEKELLAEPDNELYKNNLGVLRDAKTKSKVIRNATVTDGAETDAK